MGTTWYRRGPSYWLRRTSFVVFLLIVTGLMFGVTLNMFLSTVGGLSDGWRHISYTLQAVASTGAAGWGWAYYRRKAREAKARAASPAETWRSHDSAQRRAPGLASAGRLPALLLLPFMAPVFAWVLGMLLAMASLRELPSEAGARKALNQA
ncbi:hypothetical protein [Streptomyces violascens]|uniref:hypothetical protein n=1 Tax=Streptomyces violascens TaxID=67381 RepID=UPI00167528AA|nr:hypothetical protein [Streptomyces violascens]